MSLSVIYCHYETNVSLRKWDPLIILDASCHDLFLDVAPQHPMCELFDSVEEMCSLVSQTPTWLERIFKGADRSVLSGTGYVAGQYQLEDIDTSDLHATVPVWQIAHDYEAEFLRPEVVTNEAIKRFRIQEADRYVVHYIQLHAPFLHCTGKNDSIADSRGQPQNVWQGLYRGQFDGDEVCTHHGQNLLLVLDKVEPSKQNFDWDVAISLNRMRSGMSRTPTSNSTSETYVINRDGNVQDDRNRVATSTTPCERPMTTTAPTDRSAWEIRG